MKIINVVGARPNFMKVAPLHEAFQADQDITSKVVHTGQHYDARMSDIFFKQLELPQPDYYLGVGSGSHAEVTAKIMVEFEKILLSEQPDVVLVVGDVNSTLACAVTTKKLNIPLVHVEAGLRSGDRKMPEELNRIMTDAIADELFVTEQSGMDHLKKEGVDSNKIHFVGNVMIDSLCRYQQKAAQTQLLSQLNIKPKDFILMTMHRPSNVDRKEKIEKVVALVKQICELKKVVLPIHPRTVKQLKKHQLLDDFYATENLKILEPQGYLEFLHLMENAALIVTDSGGIQEESTYLQVPCLTIRPSTERPITITLGTNILIPKLAVSEIITQVKKSLVHHKSETHIPPLWDGKAANRIKKIIKAKYLPIELKKGQKINV